MRQGIVLDLSNKLSSEAVRRYLYTFGPAWLVMIADVDVASIVTGLQSGATWGYRLIFILLVLTIPLFIIQDAAGRLGTIAHMGLGEAIRRKYSRRISLLLAVPMAVSDFLEYVAEYAGIAIGVLMLNLPLIPTLLAFYIVHLAVVLFRNYRKAEAILLPISFILVAALLTSAILFKPSLINIVKGLSPLQPYWNPSFDYLIAANIGAVIMPWMLYFHSGADARKGLKECDLKAERLETLIGAMASELLMVATVIDGANMRGVGDFMNATELVKALSPLGKLAPLAMAVGFISSGMLALIVISMASAWGVLEALGRPGDHRSFLVIYMLESLPAIILVILYRNYVELILNLMVIYTIIIIPSLYMLGRLVSSGDVMGSERFRGMELAIYWLMVALVGLGGLVGLISSIVG